MMQGGGTETHMITVRRSSERGHADHGWLDSRHTFSFANYYDPAQMGFRALRVINEDRVAGGQGFPRHPHRDSMGTGSTIEPGDVQRMSAGTGVAHSEYNASSSEPVHFLQIWLIPARRGIAPSYEQKRFSREDKSGRLRVVASPTGQDGSVSLHSDATLYAGVFETGQSARLELTPGRHAWVHVARGSAVINGELLHAGDGAALSDEAAVAVRGADGGEAGEVLVFDLA